MKIKKNKIESFIEKYNLGGFNERVKFKTNLSDSSISVAFIAEEKNMLGKVLMTGVDVDSDVEVGIGDTKKLKSFLSILDNDIDLGFVSSDDGRVIAIQLSDDNTNMNYMAAELGSIGAVPNLKKLPNFEIELVINREFVKRFIKSKSALSEVDTFTLLPDKKTSQIKLIIGHAKNLNSNNIDIGIKAESGKDKITKELSFSAKYLKEILSANLDYFSDDTITAKLHVAEAGMANISFETPSFKADYYLTEIATR